MYNSNFDYIDQRYIDIFSMADMVNQPIHIITPDGIVRFVNQSWCMIYGVPLEEALGKHIEHIVDISNFYVSLDDPLNFDPSKFQYKFLEKPDNRSAALIAAEKKHQITMLSQTPANNQVMVTSTPIFDDEGQVTCVFTLIQDLTMLASWHDFMTSISEKNQAVQKELAFLREALNNSTILGNSKQMAELRKLISIVAPSDATILINGESGTGKEVISKEIHYKSDRQDKPFITVNCAAIPENLLESELFGHEKGSFTGAVSSKVGLFEMANHGTILLDEIGEFPLSLQPKLLRVLQEKEIRRVGGTKTIPIDVRVIAATNQNLLTMVKDSTFRTDLYYRLNVFPIKIPPLRERPEDVPPLASSFLSKFNKKYKKSKFFTPQSVIALERYSWPGNVRELENIVERLVIVGNEPSITASQVEYIMDFVSSDGQEPPCSTGFSDLKTAVDMLEKQMISDAFNLYKSTYKVAKALGTSQSTIVRKMRMLGIEQNK